MIIAGILMIISMPIGFVCGWNVKKYSDLEKIEKERKEQAKSLPNPKSDPKTPEQIISDAINLLTEEKP